MAKKKTVRMKTKKVWCVVWRDDNTVGSIYTFPPVCSKDSPWRVVGPITLREPRPRSSKR